MKVVPLSVGLLALAGCADARFSHPAAPPDLGVRCDAGPAQPFIGRHYRPALGARIRRSTGARIVRVTRSGEMVTMDIRPDRVDVTLSAKAVVTVIRCG